MLRIGFDSETYAFSDTCATPPPVCCSYGEILEAPGGYAIGRSGVLAFNYPSRGRGLALDALHEWLKLAARGEALIIGAETSFDALASVVGAYVRDERFGREFFALWKDAYELGAVTDVLIRQKLLDLAAGTYRYEELPSGVWEAQLYGLDDLSERHTGRVLDKKNPWRIRFGELDGLPIESYPRDAYDYTADDGVATAEVWIAQETSTRGGRRDPRIAKNFPGLDPLLDEKRQVRAALPLKDASNYGLRTDPAAVERFAEQVREEKAAVEGGLVAAGLVRDEYKRNSKKVLAYVEAKRLESRFGMTRQGKNLAVTPKAAAASGDPLLELLSRWKPSAPWTDEFEPLIDAGFIQRSRDTKAAAARCAAVYTAAERPIPRTKEWKEWKWDNKRGAYVGNPEHTPGSLKCVKLDADACDSSGDSLLESYSEFTSLGKALSTDIPILRKGALVPIHTRYETILDTGRTSSSRPNTQNIRRLPGIRECFVPRSGWIFSDVDYSQLELYTLAQTCFWVLGHSVLGEALRAGKDPHLMIAASILGISYEAAEKRKKENAVKNARTAGKGVNFGVPGGLGKKKFAEFCYKSYRIELGETEAEKIEAAGQLIQQFKSTWTEMPAYFKWVESLKAPTDPAKLARIRAKYQGDELAEKLREVDRYNVVQPWSGRLRAGATYCAACNSPFQGLGADVAKLAGWYIWKACYGFSELGDADPLFGCHPVNFVHDEWIVEVPEERGHEASMRQSELMARASREVMPDVGCPAPAMLCRQWSKKSEEWFEEGPSGRRLIPWDMREACAKDAGKFEAMSDAERGEALKAKGETARPTPATAETLYQYLAKQDWPRDVVRETVADRVFDAAA